MRYVWEWGLCKLGFLQPTFRPLGSFRPKNRNTAARPYGTSEPYRQPIWQSAWRNERCADACMPPANALLWPRMPEISYGTPAVSKRGHAHALLPRPRAPGAMHGTREYMANARAYINCTAQRRFKSVPTVPSQVEYVGGRPPCLQPQALASLHVQDFTSPAARGHGREPPRLWRRARCAEAACNSNPTSSTLLGFRRFAPNTGAAQAPK